MISLASNDVRGANFVNRRVEREILNGSEQLKDEPQHKYQERLL